MRGRYSYWVTGWRNEKSWFDCRQGQETLLSFEKCPKLLWGVTMLLLIGWRGPFPGVKRLRRETTRLRLVPELLSGATPPPSNML